MKKIIAILLASLLTMGVVGCGKKEEESPSSAPDTAVEEHDNSDSSPDMTKKLEEAEKELEEQVPATMPKSLGKKTEQFIADYTEALATQGTISDVPRGPIADPDDTRTDIITLGDNIYIATMSEIDDGDIYGIIYAGVYEDETYGTVVSEDYLDDSMEALICAVDTSISPEKAGEMVVAMREKAEHHETINDIYYSLALGETSGAMMVVLSEELAEMNVEDVA